MIYYTEKSIMESNFESFTRYNDIVHDWHLELNLIKK